MQPLLVPIHTMRVMLEAAGMLIGSRHRLHIVVLDVGCWISFDGRPMHVSRVLPGCGLPGHRWPREGTHTAKERSGWFGQGCKVYSTTQMVWRVFWMPQKGPAHGRHIQAILFVFPLDLLLITVCSPLAGPTLNLSHSAPHCPHPQVIITQALYKESGQGGGGKCGEVRGKGGIKRVAGLV